MNVVAWSRYAFGGYMLPCTNVLSLFHFFFSSRRRHTRYIGDWSSDVCSSDLGTNPTVISLTPLPTTSRGLLNANTTHFVRTVPVAVTISNTSPAVITQAAHGYSADRKSVV